MPQNAPKLKKRAVVVKRLKPLPVWKRLCGYIAGSGWKDYQSHRRDLWDRLPAGLQQAQQLPQPIYTPSSKAAVGLHDENIDFACTVGIDRRGLSRQYAMSAFRFINMPPLTLQHGIIIADTKFEFGVDEAGNLFLIDEVLTPDSFAFLGDG